jgi:hypothetical protein
MKAWWFSLVRNQYRLQIVISGLITISKWLGQHAVGVKWGPNVARAGETSRLQIGRGGDCKVFGFWFWGSRTSMTTIVV